MGSDAPAISEAVYSRGMTIIQFPVGEKRRNYWWSGLSAIFTFPKAVLLKWGGNDSFA